MSDEAVVTAQLGRPPRGAWRVVRRCSFGRPVVIATAPAFDDRAPFPTLFYLTCPHLVAEVSRLESAGVAGEWRGRLRDDVALRDRLERADAAYRAARTAEGGGRDPASGLGIAGQRDPFAVKCLHAHVAAVLAGVEDPVGEGVLAMCVEECEDDRCGEGT